MAKIHPNYPATSSSNISSSSSYCNSSEKETFTVWMKSLVFHGKGCTVFDSMGEVVFRVDNYQQRCSNQVFLMDSCGKVLFSINRKLWQKLWIWGCWEGFKCNDHNLRASKKRPWFQVTRNFSFWSKDISCRVSLKCNENTCYRIMGLEGKPGLKITDFSGQLLAEAVQKQSSEGVPLGDDVLTLKVEAETDHSLIMALVTVYGLISNRV
ncbi:protein LURP-one-related 11-like [Andrographis paniculata]|uniref:protein LURP-one-related 11-like n=1 Tax=Andrographis paniculata TaxID=175694 RepID=UPI0021E9ADD8|nr:protein LURP-one-related 11-like [Andrographis paniculata]